MILTGPEIKRRYERGELNITPWNPQQCRSNSYDLRLGNVLLGYTLDEYFVEVNGQRVYYLDPDRPNKTKRIPFPKKGIVLMPGQPVLAHTVESTWAEKLVPFLDGKSSCGRLFIRSHQTAGAGDTGFCGQWTLEIDCVLPVRIYPGMRICQIRFHETVGEVVDYSDQGRYQGQTGPVPSRFHEGNING